VTADNPRLQELRRRVQGDPASIAFAQLAEDCRRAGDTEEAIRISRAGLAHHPGYLSARVTLGRGLIELNQLDEARHELSIVLENAPENLAAIRAIADIDKRQGRLSDALDMYRRALSLAQFDPELEATIERISLALAPPPPRPAIPPPTEVDVEDLFDFDALLEQLGSQVRRTSPVPSGVSPETVPAPSAVDAAIVTNDDADPFSVLEQQLREKQAAPYETPAVEADRFEQDRLAADQERLATEQDGMEEEGRRQQQRVMHELESWLSAIVAERSQGA